MSTLTGQTRYRLGWGGKIVLQIGAWQRQYAVGRHPDLQPWITVWRDATFRDVIDIAEGHFSPKLPAETRMPPPPRSRAPGNVPPARNPSPPMSDVKPASFAPPCAAEATLYDVGLAAEKGDSIEYRFLGITGMEDE